MRRPLTTIVWLGLLFSVSCSSDAERAAAAKAKEFRELAAAGKLEDIRRQYASAPTDWDQYMQRRRDLGRLQQTTLASTNDVTGYYRQIALIYNSEFEHGHAVEQFVFKIEDNGPRLLTYEYLPGKKLECYLIGSCDLVDLPQ